MAGNPLASLPGLPQRPSLARSSASETRLTQPGIEGERSRKLNSAPTAAFRLKGFGHRPLARGGARHDEAGVGKPPKEETAFRKRRWRRSHVLWRFEDRG